MKVKNFLAMAAIAFCAVACSDDDDVVSSGVQKITVTSSDESKWTYANFQSGETTDVTVEGPIKYFHFKTGELVETKDKFDNATGVVPTNWDIAMNGFNIRTNNGAVLTTTAKDFAEITELPTGNYVQDKSIKAEDQIIRVDMSRMTIDGVFGFVDGSINYTLTDNIKKTPTHTMPPYEYSVNDAEHVYVIRYTNGNWAKVKFLDCFYGNGKKAITFSYEYLSK